MIGLPGAGGGARARRRGGAGAGANAGRRCRRRAARRRGASPRASTSIRSTGTGPTSRCAICPPSPAPCSTRSGSRCATRAGPGCGTGGRAARPRPEGRRLVSRRARRRASSADLPGFQHHRVAGAGRAVRAARGFRPARLVAAVAGAVRGGASARCRDAARLAGGAEAAGRARRLCARGGHGGRAAR